MLKILHVSVLSALVGEVKEVLDLFILFLGWRQWRWLWIISEKGSRRLWLQLEPPGARGLDRELYWCTCQKTSQLLAESLAKFKMTRDMSYLCCVPVVCVGLESKQRMAAFYALNVAGDFWLMSFRIDAWDDFLEYINGLCMNSCF